MCFGLIYNTLIICGVVLKDIGADVGRGRFVAGFKYVQAFTPFDYVHSHCIYSGVYGTVQNIDTFYLSSLLVVSVRLVLLNLVMFRAVLLMHLFLL